jgi:hypothetical protein
MQEASVAVKKPARIPPITTTISSSAGTASSSTLSDRARPIRSVTRSSGLRRAYRCTVIMQTSAHAMPGR